MNSTKANTSYFIFLLLLLVCCFIANLLIGSSSIQFSDIIRILTGSNQIDQGTQNILYQIRMPRAMTALLAGAALSLSGLLMQTFFRNPIAGPFVLGISSGASLGVALVVMGTGALGLSFMGHWDLAIGAILGASLSLFLFLLLSFRVQDIATLLIVGLMIGSVTSAIVTILEYLTTSQALQQFIFWGFGSLSGVTWSELFLLIPLILFCLGWALALSKALNLLLYGEEQAALMGLSINSVRVQIILVCAVLAGSITAFCGPIAFIGIAVPHFARMLFKTQEHRILIPATILCGASVLLLCDIISHLPLWNQHLPINAITSILGGPMVIWIILMRRRI